MCVCAYPYVGIPACNHCTCVRVYARVLLCLLVSSVTWATVPTGLALQAAVADALLPSMMHASCKVHAAVYMLVDVPHTVQYNLLFEILHALQALDAALEGPDFRAFADQVRCWGAMRKRMCEHGLMS